MEDKEFVERQKKNRLGFLTQIYNAVVECFEEKKLKSVNVETTCELENHDLGYILALILKHQKNLDVEYKSLTDGNDKFYVEIKIKD